MGDVRRVKHRTFTSQAWTTVSCGTENQRRGCLTLFWIYFPHTVSRPRRCEDSPRRHLIRSKRWKYIAKISRTLLYWFELLKITQPRVTTTTFLSGLKHLCGSHLQTFSRVTTSLTSLSIFQFNRRLMVEFHWRLEIFTTRPLPPGSSS